jgi:hypothetical protein
LIFKDFLTVSEAPENTGFKPAETPSRQAAPDTFFTGETALASAPQSAMLYPGAKRFRSVSRCGF